MDRTSSWLGGRWGTSRLFLELGGIVKLVDDRGVRGRDRILDGGFELLVSTMEDLRILEEILSEKTTEERRKWKVVLRSLQSNCCRFFFFAFFIHGILIFAESSRNSNGKSTEECDLLREEYWDLFKLELTFVHLQPRRPLLSFPSLPSLLRSAMRPTCSARSLSSLARRRQPLVSIPSRLLHSSPRLSTEVVPSPTIAADSSSSSSSSSGPLAFSTPPLPAWPRPLPEGKLEAYDLALEFIRARHAELREKERSGSGVKGVDKMGVPVHDPEARWQWEQGLGEYRL